jgi:dipeptidyl aminopeptidase/acylaminoacyl peptidase
MAEELAEISWTSRSHELRGALFPARDGGPAPLVTCLPGGPVRSLVAQLESFVVWPDPRWSVFVPTYPAMGVCGDDAERRARESRRVEGVDDDLDAITGGIDAVVASGGADPGRLGLIGFSFGAYLVGRAITFSSRFKAAIICEGVADLRHLDAKSVALQSEWLGGGPDEAPAAWDAASPIRFADQVRTPTLLSYGADWTLEPHGRLWANAFEIQGLAYQLNVLEGQGHVFDRHGVTRFRESVATWLERFLLNA